ncbi:MAG: YbaN family protein [Bacteroidaceae bacterium]|nr:YbaN family protein [Bacteroidaceae bacterium]
MKIIFNILGSIFLTLGVIGIFLPVLPTTPFLLLTAYCYYRGSEKMYSWLMNHPKFGPHITLFREQRIIPRKTKIYILTLLWVSLLFCSYILTPIWLKALMIIIAISVTIHILSYPSENR